jgi:hypothetical protein
MKNLLNRIDIEQMEEFPSWLSFNLCLDGNYELRDNYEHKKWHNRKRKIMYRKADAIIRSSVGKHWDEVHSKLSALVRYNPYGLTVDELTYSVIKPYLSTKTNRYEFIERHGHAKDLYKYIKDISARERYRHEVYWICPETNVLKCVMPTRNSHPNKEQVRKNYEKQQAIRISRKKEDKIKEERGVKELLFINSPDLYKFYVELVKKRESLITTINKKPQEKPKLEFFKGLYPKVPISNPHLDLLKRLRWWRYMNSRMIVEAKKAKKELEIVQEQINNLESGNLNVFYHSNLYLYSLQKECHHFAQP